MKKYLRKFSNLLIIGFAFALMQGCTDNEQINVNRVFKQAQLAQNITDNNFKQLDAHVSNPTKKGKYEMTLNVALATIANEMKDNEAVDDMVKQFKIDMTKSGVIWKEIEADYKKVTSSPDTALLSSKDENAPKKKLGAITNLLNNYNSFNKSHNLVRYDERFIDYINTLAAISKNISPVVVDTLDKDAPVGSAFVGNPQYGEWKKDSNGNDVWQFLETYMYLSFLNNMLFDNNYNHGYRDYSRGYRSNNDYYSSSSRRGGYGYSSWSNNRNYSYYNDTYVDKYAKPTERKKYTASKSNLTKKYKSTIKKDNNVSKQLKTMSPKNKAFQSSISRPKTSTKSSTSGTNSGSSSGNKKASQSNISRSSKTVRNTSKSVSFKSGK